MIESGRVILARDLQLKNALGPISITDGGISTLTSDIQSKNAPRPMTLQECGIFTSFNNELLWNKYEGTLGIPRNYYSQN